MATISGLTVALMAEKCIGHVHATGDATHDMEAVMHLHELCVVINTLLMDVHGATQYISSDTPCAQVLGGRAISYLAELRDDIDLWLKDAWGHQKRGDDNG